MTNIPPYLLVHQCPYLIIQIKNTGKLGLTNTFTFPVVTQERKACTILSNQDESSHVSCKNEVAETPLTSWLEHGTYLDRLPSALTAFAFI